MALRRWSDRQSQVIGGLRGYGVPVAVDQWYDFHEFGCHLGNVRLNEIADLAKALRRPSIA